MKIEIRRQLVHLSGILFIVLAQYIGQLVSVYFLAVAVTLFLYSQIILREFQNARLLDKLESKIRDFTMKFERNHVTRPFTGAIWFFFSLGLTFLIFPLPIASAAGMMLAVGDSLATLIGKRFGRIKILGQKTLEGTLMLVLGSLTALFFVSPVLALFGMLAAAFGELLPESSLFSGLRNKGIVDDNLFVPLLAGVVMLLAIGFVF